MLARLNYRSTVAVLIGGPVGETLPFAVRSVRVCVGKAIFLQAYVQQCFKNIAFASEINDCRFQFLPRHYLKRCGKSVRHCQFLPLLGFRIHLNKHPGQVAKT